MRAHGVTVQRAPTPGFASRGPDAHSRRRRAGTPTSDRLPDSGSPLVTSRCPRRPLTQARACPVWPAKAGARSKRKPSASPLEKRGWVPGLSGVHAGGSGGGLPPAGSAPSAGRGDRTARVPVPWGEAGRLGTCCCRREPRGPGALGPGPGPRRAPRDVPAF